jgi:hypothetical protein
MLGSCGCAIYFVLMHIKAYRKWKVLCWNVRGLNSEERQREVRSKIEESQCAVVCLQETKCDYFDHRFIRKFCPKRFDNFVYSPSVGASGGIIILWNSAIFSGSVQQIKSFGIVVNILLFTMVKFGLWSLFMGLVRVFKGTISLNGFIPYLFLLRVTGCL